jgi:2-iminobutanoate/2-iminopropanoate deaminase
MTSSRTRPLRETINVASVPKPKGYKSMAVRAGDLVFVSGQIGKGADGLPLPTLREQAEGSFRQIQEILEAAGTSMANVVKMTILVTDIGFLTEIQEVKRMFLSDDPPATLGAAVSALALGALCEIDAIATVGE